jgi:hypothetical protein
MPPCVCGLRNAYRSRLCAHTPRKAALLRSAAQSRAKKAQILRAIFGAPLGGAGQPVQNRRCHSARKITPLFRSVRASLRRRSTVQGNKNSSPPDKPGSLRFCFVFPAQSPGKTSKGMRACGAALRPSLFSAPLFAHFASALCPLRYACVQRPLRRGAPAAFCPLASPRLQSCRHCARCRAPLSAAPG